jgi:hypothetical protein
VSALMRRERGVREVGDEGGGGGEKNIGMGWEGVEGWIMIIYSRYEEASYLAYLV